MSLKTPIGAIAALLLAGCVAPYSPAPLATNYPVTKQNKPQAAAHWMVISAHIEKELSATLKPGPKVTLYVEPPQATAFNQALRNQLITSLVNDGFMVTTSATNPAGALSVSVETQVVEFNANRPHYKFGGEASALAAGLWVLTDIDGHTPLGLATAAVAGADAFAWFRSEFAAGDTPKMEIIVTTSVRDEHRYLARSTSVYYVTDSDRSLYQITPHPKETPQISKNFTVRGGSL